jgi:hypothetical protein
VGDWHCWSVVSGVACSLRYLERTNGMIDGFLLCLHITPFVPLVRPS